ncbi:MAG: hypothetical protein MJ229_00110 [bacterium]|nr:hypothetical protein [bacterium]
MYIQKKSEINSTKKTIKDVSVSIPDALTPKKIFFSDFESTSCAVASMSSDLNLIEALDFNRQNPLILKWLFFSLFSIGFLFIATSLIG